MGLPNHYWLRLEPVIPKRKIPCLRRQRRGGRPRFSDRKCFEALLWLVRSGGTCKSLPARFGNPRTVQRRLARWDVNATLAKLWRAYFQLLPRADRQALERAAKTAALRRNAWWRLDFECQSRFNPG